MRRATDRPGPVRPASPSRDRATVGRTETAYGLDGPLPPEALLADYPPPMASLAEGLRRIVREAVPESVERVRPGWRVIGYDLPLGRRSAFFAWVMPERRHVHLGFPKGVLLDDPAGALEGAGITKAARWFTLREPDDLDDERLARFVLAAAAAARLSAPEQALMRQERAEAQSSRR